LLGPPPEESTCTHVLASASAFEATALRRWWEKYQMEETYHFFWNKTTEGEVPATITF
jgi:hypothetical protein